LIYPLLRKARATSLPGKAASNPETKQLLVFILLLCSLSAIAQTPTVPDSANKSLANLKVDVDYSDISIEDALNDISKRYEIDFSYANNIIPLDKRVSITQKDIPLELVLDSVFDDVGISYFIIGRMVVLKKKNIALAGSDISIRDTILAKNKTKAGLRQVKDSITSAPMPPKPDSLPAKLKKDTLDYQYGISIFWSPESSFRTLRGDSDVAANRNTFEKSKKGFSVGVNINYYLTKFFFFQSGLYYMNFGEKGSYTYYVNYISPKNPDHHYAPPSFYTSSGNVSYRNNYDFLGIPFLAGLKAGGRFTISGSTGFILGVLLNRTTNYPANPYGNFRYPPPTTVYDRYQTDLDPRRHDYKTFDVIYLLNFQMAYRVNKSVSFFIAPTLKGFVTSIYTFSDPIKERPNSFGFQFGTTILFGKHTKL